MKAFIIAGLLFFSANVFACDMSDLQRSIHEHHAVASEVDQHEAHGSTIISITRLFDHIVEDAYEVVVATAKGSRHSTIYAVEWSGGEGKDCETVTASRVIID